MSQGFKIWNVLQSDYLNHNPHVAGALVTAGIFVLGGVIYRVTTPSKKISKTELASADEEALVPSEKFSTRNMVESISEFVQNSARDIIGPHYPKFLPLLIFIFLWILVNNLIGMVPGFGSATTDFNTTLSMGIFVFVFYNIQGFLTNGVKYLEHFTGHLHGVLLLALGWLMFPLELISHAIRPVTLGIRLRTNIFADHTLTETIGELVGGFGHFLTVKIGAVGNAIAFVLSSLIPVPFLLLGILTCLVQALVFTLLTSVYISIATAHEDH